jgi:hypothetical protein
MQEFNVFFHFYIFIIRLISYKIKKFIKFFDFYFFIVSFEILFFLFFGKNIPIFAVFILT